MNKEAKMNLMGKPSIDRPWLKYYPSIMREMKVPECTLLEYLKKNCPGNNVAAIHYYGKDILWETLFNQVDIIASSLNALGVKEGDQIPVFLQSVPEFIYLLLAVEKIGASLVCRDNTLEENIDAVRKSNSKIMIAHDYLGYEEMEKYLSDTKVEKIILVDTCYSCDYESMPDYIQNSLNQKYPVHKAYGEHTLNWSDFLSLSNGDNFDIMTTVDLDRPLLRAYTSGSTGPSKQVIHSSKTMLSVISQMNFYAVSNEFRSTWMLTILPPALVAVVVSMILIPLSSNRLLILSPFCDPNDVDLELMRYQPNAWPIIPMFIETVMKNGRIPDDYDMSFLLACGVGCESYNNVQIKNAQKFLNDHNCNVRFTVAYGCSEAGSNITLQMTPHPISNGNVGIPMPLNIISIFKPGTHEELGYNQVGEICISGPGNMLGYDQSESTEEALQIHEDGRVWLHTGDIGFMNIDGVIYTMTRGKAPRYGGGDLATLPMENRIADANIQGIKDEFFVIVPDTEHDGYYVPYLYVVLENGYAISDVTDAIIDSLEPYMYPVDIVAVSERPFFHFKTNRIGLTKEILNNIK